MALTDVNDLERAIPLIRPHLGSHQPSGGFVAQPVEYTFLELARHRTLLRGSVFAIEGVVALGVNESENRVRVGIEHPSAENEVRNLLTVLEIPPDQVILRTMPRVVLNTDSLANPWPDSTIQGAWQIESAAGQCTLGFPALRTTGAPVFVTNSHCTDETFELDQGWFKQPNSNGPIIGYEIVDPDPHTCGYPLFTDDCRASDAALISANIDIDLGKVARTVERLCGELSDASTVISASNPTLTITSRNGNVFENETVDKIGISTGWTCGAVESTCDDHEGADSMVRECADRVDYSSEDGDSGSPVFYLKGDGTIELRGIHYGYLGGPYEDAMMSDLAQIEADLGSLIVVDQPVAAILSGPVSVPPNAHCEWTGAAAPGWPPYQYEWRRDGVVVSTSNSYSTSSTGTTDFQLQFKVTDNRPDSDTDVVAVTIDHGRAGEIIC